jgi:hypothetical protein
VGKTELVQTLAERKGASLYDLRLTTIEPQDLRGLPFYDHEKGRTVWYRPEDLPDDPDRPAILFLDELTAAAPTLQPTVYGLLQERRVGRHRLPDSVFIVAAGNMVEDGAIAYEMGTALSDRLIHVIVQADAEDWLKSYAPGAGIHPAVAAFLRGRPDLLETTEDALRRGHTIACTPRSWTRVSQILQAVPDRAARQVMIAGTVGEAAAAEFALIADEIEASVQVAAMLAGGARRPGGDVSRHAPRPHRADLRADRRGGRGDPSGGIEILADMRGLPTPKHRALPLSELASFGFELLIGRALEQGWQDVFARSDAYADYAREREAVGL